MGVNRTDYILLGVKVDDGFYEKIEPDLDDAYEKYVEPYEDNGYEDDWKDGLTVILDGMLGKYAFIGKIISKSIDDGNGLPVTNCSDFSDDEKNSISLLIEEQFKIKNPEVDLWVFTHWH